MECESADSEAADALGSRPMSSFILQMLAQLVPLSRGQISSDVVEVIKAIEKFFVSDLMKVAWNQIRARSAQEVTG